MRKYRVGLGTTYSLARIEVSKETAKMVIVESFEVLLGNEYLGLWAGIIIRKEGCVFDTLPEAVRELTPFVKQTLGRLEGRLSELRGDLLKLEEIAREDRERRE